MECRMYIGTLLPHSLRHLLMFLSCMVELGNNGTPNWQTGNTSNNAWQLFAKKKRRKIVCSKLMVSCNTVIDLRLSGPAVRIFGGGDCFSSEGYWSVVENSGVDGVMIGVGNWSFSVNPSGRATPQSIRCPSRYSRHACPAR